MKQIILFILSFGIGIALFLGYQKYRVTPQPTIITTKKVVMKPYIFPLEKAPTESQIGSISSLQGEVYFQSRVATEPAQITEPMQVQQGEKVITGQTAKAVVQFPELIEATMSANTELEFIQTILSSPVILQTQGSVSYQKLGTISPNIRTMRLLTAINQGISIFSVDTDNSTVIIDVISGSVTVGFNDIDAITNQVTISADQQYIFDNELQQGRIQSL